MTKTKKSQKNSNILSKMPQNMEILKKMPPKFPLRITKKLKLKSQPNNKKVR